MFLKSELTSYSKQKGISMAFLLFTMIVISLLATGLMRLNSQSSLSNAHQVISTRAFFAAESGAQLQALVIFPLAGGGVCGNNNYNFTVGGLNGCRANTTCNSTTIGGDIYYQVVSVGQCNIGQPLQATRTIETRLKAINTP